MTQPDQLLPGGAWNSEDFGPISVLAAKPQADWEAEMNAQALAGHQATLDALFGDLPSGMRFPMALLTALGRSILGNPSGSWPTLAEINAALKAHFDEIQAKADASADKFAYMLDTWLGTGSTIADFTDWLQDRRDDADAARADISTLITGFVSGTATMNDVVTVLNNIEAKSDENADNFAHILDTWLGTGSTIADFTDWLQERRDEQQATWNSFWQGIFGGSATNKTAADVKVAAELVSTKATDFENLSAGSNFEGTHPWGVLPTGWTLDTVQKFSGTQSLKIAANAALGPTLLPGTFQTREGEKFYVEVRARRDAAYNGTSGTSKVRLGTVQGDALIGALAYGAVDLPAADTWYLLSTTITVGAGITGLSATLGRDSTAGNVWLDDLVIRRVTDINRIPTSELTTMSVPALQTISDYIAQAFRNDPTIDSTLFSDAKAAMTRIYEMIQGNTRALQQIQATAVSTRYSGKTIDIDFSDYPNGPLPASLTVTHSGSGTGDLAVVNGIAQWSGASNTVDRTADVISVESTDSDWQVLRGTMSAPPQNNPFGTAPRFRAKMRESADELNYVWIEGWDGGFANYTARMGCTINGVDREWVNDIDLTWALDMAVVAGVGANDRQYELYSGGTMVYRYTESSGYVATYANLPSNLGAGGAGKKYIVTADGKLYTWSGTAWTANGAGITPSVMGSTARRFGARARIITSTGWSSSTPRHSGTLAGLSVSDNQPPELVGPTAHMYRTSTTTVSWPSGWSAMPNGFWQVVLRRSNDITIDANNLSFTVSKAGTYAINVQLRVSASLSALFSIGLVVNGSYTQVWNCESNTSRGGNAFKANFVEYLAAGDVVTIHKYHNGFTGNYLEAEATGLQMFFNIAALSLSYN